MEEKNRVIPGEKRKRKGTVDQIANDLYDQLLNEAEENFAAAEKNFYEYQHEIRKALMMLFAAGRDDDFLSESEKALLKEAEQTVEQLPLWKEYWFWKDRVDKLKAYNYRIFFEQLSAENEIDDAIASALLSDSDDDGSS